jgi:hypothetical protein
VASAGPPPWKCLFLCRPAGPGAEPRCSELKQTRLLVTLPDSAAKCLPSPAHNYISKLQSCWDR